MSKGNGACPSRNLPTEWLDELVLAQFEGRVLTTAKLLDILQGGASAAEGTNRAGPSEPTHLQNQPRKDDERLNRLYEAVETGLLPLDETLQRRIQKAKADREARLIEMAGMRRLQSLPLAKIHQSQVQAFSRLFRARLRERKATFGRSYLHALVDEVVIHDTEAVITGSHAKLAQAVAAGQAQTEPVPGFMQEWRAREDSNL